MHYLDKLKECHNRLATNLNAEAEPFDIVASVEEHRRYWQPERLKVILLAESHVRTSREEHAVRVTKLPTDLPGCPTAFVKFVYCLGYGENSLLEHPLSIRHGTPQYWRLFLGCCRQFHSFTDGYLVQHRTPFSERIENKIRLLKLMQNRGIWLLDASIVALYPKPSDRGLVNQVIERSWYCYVREMLNQSERVAILCIGEGLGDLLQDDLRQLAGDRLRIIPQPNAYLSAERQLEVLRICYEFCRQYAPGPDFA